jgi:hypothetical protein
MHLIRRGPHAELGNEYERQCFECPNLHTMERNVDSQGRLIRSI